MELPVRHRFETHPNPNPIPNPNLELGHRLEALRHRAHVVGVALAQGRAALVALEEGLARLRARLRLRVGLGRPAQG